MKAIESIRAALGPRLREAVPLRQHTTYRVGGPAEYFFVPAGAEEAAFVYREALGGGVPLTVIGWGSNVIAPDEGISGLVMCTRSDAGAVRFLSGGRVFAEAGADLMTLSRAAAGRGLGGLEAIAGIPGTLGGAVVMNAGTKEGDTAAVLVSVAALTPAGRRRVLRRDEAGFGYRRSIFQESGWLVLGAELRLRAGKPDVLRRRLDEIARERKEKFPLDTPNAGSVFKRPAGDYAGRLIEAAGCKGLRIGGAEVSRRHANFIVNAGGATAADILALVVELRRRVFEQAGVWLELEQIPLPRAGLMRRGAAPHLPPGRRDAGA